MDPLRAEFDRSGVAHLPEFVPARLLQAIRAEVDGLLVGLAQRRTFCIFVESAARILRTEPDSAPWVAWRESLWEAARAAWHAFEAGASLGPEVQWKFRLERPPRSKPRTLAGNYGVRQDGTCLGNSAAILGA